MAVPQSVECTCEEPNRSRDRRLTPGQQRTFDLLVSTVHAVPISVLEGDVGLGKTTVLQHLQSELGARFIDLGEVVASFSTGHPHAVEEGVRRLMEETLTHDEPVILDDFDYLATVTKMNAAYPRPYLLEAVLKAVFADVRARDKKLIVAQRNAERSYEILTNQSVRVTLPALGAADYAAIVAQELGLPFADENVPDVEKVFRFASKLNGYQLSAVCRLLMGTRDVKPTTAAFIDCIGQYILSSNTRVSEVAQVSFEDLKGAEDLIEKLERYVLLPMLEAGTASRLGLKPKRGVLLHGRPGTGKTSVGRALAHQMKGKFFMIDGTFITEPANRFFARVRQVFEDAKANSPSVIFIDDADVLFKTDHVYGLNRYLLTMLDGLESETVGNVCVMMTAMNVADMPPALLRSGRIEVWLETKLPISRTRAEIIDHYMKELPSLYQDWDLKLLIPLTDGFTPADLRRIVGDAKALLVYDSSKGRAPRKFGEYLIQAAAELRDLKEKVAGALGDKMPKAADSETAQR